MDQFRVYVKKREGLWPSRFSLESTERQELAEDLTHCEPTMDITVNTVITDRVQSGSGRPCLRWSVDVGGS